MSIDQAFETTPTTGTGALTLSGAVDGYRTLISKVGNGNTCYYVLIHKTYGMWEIGLGTIVGSDPDTLSRDVVSSSSNGDELLDLVDGIKNVFIFSEYDGTLTDGDIDLDLNVGVITRNVI